jgi:hypothetical protein
VATSSSPLGHNHSPVVAEVPDRIYLGPEIARVLLWLRAEAQNMTGLPGAVILPSTSIWPPTLRVPGVLRTALGGGEAGEIES